MYRGFNYTGTTENKEYIKIAKNSYETQKGVVSKSIKGYLQNNGVLNGTKMRNDWFPELNCDVFISHAHSDENKALTLAGWLLDQFEITSFVDSCVWGYSDILLKTIDDEYCYNSKTNTYNYRDRNYSTSHIHMMLASALTMMIDKSECLFFLNTPSSLSVSNIEDKTFSPWIYHELTISKYIKKRFPIRHKSKRLLDENLILKEAGLKIDYDLDLSYLVKISESNLDAWGDQCESTGLDALDDLYKRHPVKKRSLSLLHG